MKAAYWILCILLLFYGFSIGIAKQFSMPTEEDEEEEEKPGKGVVKKDSQGKKGRMETDEEGKEIVLEEQDEPEEGDDESEMPQLTEEEYQAQLEASTKRVAKILEAQKPGSITVRLFVQETGGKKLTKFQLAKIIAQREEEKAAREEQMTPEELKIQKQKDFENDIANRWTMGETNAGTSVVLGEEYFLGKNYSLPKLASEEHSLLRPEHIERFLNTAHLELVGIHESLHKYGITYRYNLAFGRHEITYATWLPDDDIRKINDTQFEDSGARYIIIIQTTDDCSETNPNRPKLRKELKARYPILSGASFVCWKPVPQATLDALAPGEEPPSGFFMDDSELKKLQKMEFKMGVFQKVIDAWNFHEEMTRGGEEQKLQHALDREKSESQAFVASLEDEPDFEEEGMSRAEL